MDDRIQRYADPYQLDSSDNKTPLTFNKWIKTHYGIIPSNAEKQYQDYLLDWYQSNTATQTEQVQKLKTNYLELLDSLKILFKNDPELARFSEMDVSDSEQLSVALPYFANRLKNLAVYYISQREELKSAKIKKTLKGSEKGISTILRNKLLRQFGSSGTPNVAKTSERILSNEELSTMAAYMDIRIVELDDYTDYSNPDTSFQIPHATNNPLVFLLLDYVSTYYNAYYVEDIPLSAMEFPYPLVNNSEDNYTINQENIIRLNEKLLGNDFHFIQGGYYTTAYDDVIWSFVTGVNTFPYPSNDLKNNKYAPIGINELGLNSIATFSFELSSSDLMFVDDGETLQGAWFGIPFDELDSYFYATMKQGKKFRFPFPGMGHMTTDNSWSGPELNDSPDNTSTFFPIQNRTKEKTEEAEYLYWNSDLSLTAVGDVSIHDSSLIENGAYANFKYANADKISTNGNKFAWLYDIQMAQLPIGINNNLLYFPIQTYTNNKDIIIDYPKTDSTELSALDVNKSFLGSTASYDISTADMIFELDMFGTPVSASWLYSPRLDYKIDKQCACKYNPTITISVYKTIDAHIILDRSGSMKERDPVTKKTKYQIAKEAIMDFARQENVVNIRITFFNEASTNAHTSRWFSIKYDSDQAEFEKYFTTTYPTAGGWTNYIAALENVQRNWKLPTEKGDLMQIYFISDGCPQPVANGITPTRLATWEKFLADSNVDFCFSIGIPPILAGNNNYTIQTALDNLKAVAWPKEDNPNLDNDDNNMVILDSVNGLKPFLYKTNIKETIEKTLDLVYYTGLTYTDGSKQPSLSFVANAGKTIKFVWDGDSSDINNISEFCGYSHEAYCKYKFDDNNKLIPTKKTHTYSNLWKDCNCQSVYRSPLGHTGEKFTDNYGYADYIVMDNMPVFDPLKWKGRDGKGIGESVDFAWFKLNSDETDSPVGWGKGQWINGNGDSFGLLRGEMYDYIRNPLANGPTNELPFFVIHHPYCEQTYCYWKKAIKSSTGEWIDADEKADLLLKYGESYNYLHRSNKTFKTNRLTLNGEYVNDEYIEISPTDGAIAYKTVTHELPSVNFLMTVELTERRSPFWAKANTQEDLNGLVGPKEHTIVLDYVQHVQPEFSDMIFRHNDVIEYDRSTCAESCFIWAQPITLTIDSNAIEGTWYDIDIDTCCVPLLLDILVNGTCKECNKPYDSANEGKCNTCYADIPVFIKEVIFGKCGCDANICDPTVTTMVKTYNPSALVIDKSFQNKQIKIHYVARNALEHTVSIPNINNGLPPNGGLWIETLSGIHSSAKEPWKNLMNAEFAVIASKPSDNKITERYDLGLVFPSSLGIGKYEIRKGNIIYTNIDNLTGDKLIRNPSYFIDEGMELESLDSSWMKIQTGKAKGNIISSPYKRFIGYTGIDQYITENYDYVHSHSSDVFGNNYYLLKNDSGTVAERRNGYGRIVVKTWNGEFLNFPDFNYDFMDKIQHFDTIVTEMVDISGYGLSAIDHVYSPHSEITANQVKEMNVFYDMIGIQVPNSYILHKNIENLKGRETEFNSIYVFETRSFNHWFDEKSNTIWFVSMEAVPRIWSYTINSNVLRLLYHDDSASWDFSFTINGNPNIVKTDDRIFVTGIMELPETSASSFIISEYSGLYDASLECLGITALTGDFGNKRIVETYPREGNIIITMEEQTNPNNFLLYAFPI